MTDADRKAEDAIRTLLLETTRLIAARIGADCPAGVGFALLLFELNDGRGGPGWVTYASNGNRADVRGAFQQAGELLDKEQGGAGDRG